MQIDHPLVNPHLEAVPSLGSFTTWSLPGSDAKDFVGHTHRPFHTQFLLLGRIDQIRANLLQ